MSLRNFLQAQTLALYLPVPTYAPDTTLRVRFTSRRNPHQALRPFVHNVMRVHHPGQPAPVFVFTLTEVLAN